MRGKKWILPILAGIMLCLSGCFFKGVDELYVIPKSSETYVNLQEKIKEVKGTAEYIAPQSGTNTQIIQMVDLNGDDIQEAVAFFRDNTAEKPLKICIFKQNADGNYEVFAWIEGAGTEIESIEYRNLTGNRNYEILVSWKVSAGVHTLVAYNVSYGQVTELMRSGYTDYLTTNLDQDAQDEILLVQTDSGNPSSNRMELYDSDGGYIVMRSSAPLSEGTNVTSWKVGPLEGGAVGLFVTRNMESGGRITDILAVVEDKLKNLSYDPKTGQSLETVRHYTGVEATDIDEDGMIEVPLCQAIPVVGNANTNETFWQVQWWQYNAGGVRRMDVTTYYNNTDHWYLTLPESWNGVITLSRRENTAIGERAVVFSYWNGDKKTEPDSFLVIYQLTGTNRTTRAKLNHRFTFCANSEAIYAAEFADCVWDCGLDQQRLTDRFHLISNEWLLEDK